MQAGGLMICTDVDVDFISIEPHPDAGIRPPPQPTFPHDTQKQLLGI
jgi:hypothetical protein